MSPSCTICRHPKRAEIDKALIADESMRVVASRYGSTFSSLQRHKNTHLSTGLLKAHVAKEATQADDLFAQLNQYVEDARRIGRNAEAEGNGHLALLAIRELVRIAELLAKVRGELESKTVVNVQNNTVNVRAVIVSELAGAVLRVFGPDGAQRLEQELIALDEKKLLTSGSE